MRKLLYILISVVSLFATNAFAASSDNDSVFNPSLSTPAASQTSNSGTTSGDVITGNSYNEYQYGACPAGFTYNGSSQFPNQVRTVTDLYSNGIYTGTTYSAWYDLDADCQTTEYQQIACPTNYTGVYYQSRQVTTSDTGYQYSDWTTYGDDCVYNPPPPPQPVCKDDGQNYIARMIPPFWNTPDYYSVWDSSITVVINGVMNQNQASSGIWGYEDSVNQYLAGFGAYLGDQVSVTERGDTGIVDVINKVCTN